MSVVPQSVKELLLKWILQRFDQSKIDQDIGEHGYSNIYSWVSGTTNSEHSKQVQAILKSYILSESGRFHKTRVYFSDSFITDSLNSKVNENQEVKLRKFKVEKEGPITFRWVIQVRPKVQK